jgi:hypothetical protein
LWFRYALTKDDCRHHAPARLPNLILATKAAVLVDAEAQP